MNKQYKSLLNRVNKVTSCWRHGMPITTKMMDELMDAQLACEKAIERDEKIKERALRNLK